MSALEYNKKRHEHSATELRAALKRLKDGKPTHPELQNDATISILSVAKEAGLTPQAVHRRHKDIITEINLARKLQPRRKNTLGEERIRKVMLEDVMLRDALQKLTSENATLLHRAVEAERALIKLKSARRT